MSRARMDWMDTLRGGAVVAVIGLHAQLTTTLVTGAALRPLVWVNEHLEPVRMPLLMLLSGVLLSRSLAKGLHRHVAGKVRAILWPYAVWMAVDLAHVLLDAASAGRPVPWHLVGQAFHDPQGYLWFLGWLFAFHLLAGPLPAPVRTALMVGGFVLAHGVSGLDPDAARFVWLFPFFLLGDVLGRALPGRVPPAVAVAARRVHVPALASVGRSSIVYYVCHMPVVVYAVPLLWAGLEVRMPWLVWVLTVGLALAAGRALAAVQHAPRWRLLFAWPRANVTQPTVGNTTFPVFRDAMSH
ncbi:acyltransferase family protein [Nocardioides jiangxiensis]|uniref:Acyltransferase family protein n=1 Tax=Nocardioides jiangxiensis TaxID=3064524 RepID=A0ABT9B0Z3_9ACTN|nr:acyltransferase family protein [Nocardioides sp. WY-20]MDO7866941.1 acyltransferase family protein [Nocardioides sp. WY-20]